MYMGRFGLIVSLMGAMRIFYRIKNVLKWENKMLLNANVVAYGAMVDLIKRTGRLDLDMDSGTHVDDFPAEIRIFTDNGLICLSITSVYLSGEDNLMVDGYDDDNDKVDGVDVYYDQISEVVYLAKVILEEMEEKDHGESS